MEIKNQLFKGRTLLIVTKHKKESVLLPLLEHELGVRCIVSHNFDTDRFGTFTGEKERNESPIETARKKCLSAMEQFNTDLAIASEGSFGMHPYNFFCCADEEILLLMDSKNNFEIHHCEISTQTNFNGKYISTKEELIEFAKKCNFPEHALIIRKSNNDNTEIIKDIKTWDELFNYHNTIYSRYGKAFVETDMRAMNNPMRMAVIEKSARKLIEKIQSLCPQCQFPGFSITNRIKGLLCKSCRLPTQSTIAHEYRCQSCGWTKKISFPNGYQKEDPMYCDHCNP